MTALLGSEFRLPRQVDSTLLASARECLAKFQFEHGRGLSSPTKAVDLVAGGALAAGREALYRAAYMTESNRSQALDAARHEFSTEWGDFVLPPESKSPKTKERTWELLVDYARVFDPPNDHLRPALQRVDPAFEWPFSVPLTRETTGTAEEWPLHPSGEPFVYAGRLDAVVEAGGMVLGLDDKTTSRFPSVDTWVAGLSMRAQMIGYNWVLRKLIDPKCDSFIVRQGAIRSTGVEWRESPLIPISTRLVERWLETTRLTLETLVRQNASGVWPAVLSDACVAWSRPCQFLSACRARDPEAHLEGFVVRRWNPLANSDMET